MISFGMLFFESPYKCSLAPPANSTVGPFLESPLSYRTREVVCLFSAFTSKIKALLVFKFKW